MNKILIALMAGFVAGILLAPDKGSVARKKISDGFDGLSDQFSDLLDKFTPEESLEDEIDHALPKMSAPI